MRRDEEGKEKARNRSSRYDEDFLRNLTKSQAIDFFCSKRWFIEMPFTSGDHIFNDRKLKTPLKKSRE